MSSGLYGDPNQNTPIQNGGINVTQYGWTDKEVQGVTLIMDYLKQAQDLYKQSKILETSVKDLILQLVDLKALSDAIRVMYDDFILKYPKLQETLDTVHQQVLYIEGIAKTVEDDKNEVTRLHVAVVQIKASVEQTYAAIQAILADVTAKAQQVSSDKTTVAANLVEVTRLYNECKNLVDELRAGQVYRGTWNPNSGAWPPHLGTNSVWDVTLNKGQTEVTWNGIKWIWGDRLLYVLSSSSYEQIESGVGVLSVNGKTGFVSITPADIGAIPMGGDAESSLYLKRLDTRTDDKIPTNLKDGLSQEFKLNTVDGFNQGGSFHAVLSIKQWGDITGGLSKQLAFGDNGKVGLRVGTSDYNGWGRWSMLYGENNKPTATDVGALPIAGGTINGGITVRDGVAITGTGKVIETIGGYIRSDRDDVMSLDGKTYSFVTAPNDAHLCGNAYSDGRAWLKYDNNRPSAYAVCGGNGEFNVFISVAGNSNPQQLKALTVSNDGNLSVAGGAHVGSTMTLARGANDVFIHNKTSDQYLQLKNNGELHYSSNKVYHEGFKPTATDVGALPIAGGTINGGITVHDGVAITGIGKVVETIGGCIRSSSAQVMSLDGKVYSFVTSPLDAHLCMNAYRDGTNWKKYNDNVASSYVVCSDGGQFNVFTSVAGNSSPQQLKALTVSNDGNLTVAGNASANDVLIRSDRRLKANLQPVGNALAKVNQLTAYTYDKKRTICSGEYDKHEVGLIAQDVEKVLPEAIGKIVDGDDEVLTISNSAVNALLVEAVKELSAKVESLEKKLKEVENVST